jgi:hypothetical protein
MILPTKHLNSRRSLVGVGATVLELLDEPKTVSRLWDEYKVAYSGASTGTSGLTYDWFVLGLDFLFAVGVVVLSGGLVSRVQA